MTFRFRNAGIAANLPGQSLLRVAKRLLDARYAPHDRRHSDVYLVEYPRSGVTWLSTMLAKAALIESNRREEVNFCSVNAYVPDIHVSRDIGDLAYDRPFVRFIKSHAMENAHYHFLVYLVRRPEAVMKSYFKYVTGGLARDPKDFRNFCLSSKHGLPAWRRHTESWLSGKDETTRMFLLRYEDLCADALSELTNMNNFFGWNFSEQNLRTAVSTSSREMMRETEEFYRLRNPRHKIEFVRLYGTEEADGWLLEEVAKTCEKELRLLGYK